MKPFELEELPSIFIPHATIGFYCMPPVLRRGYPVTEPALLHLLEGKGYTEIPDGESSARIIALYAAQEVLQERLQWQVKWELVHGAPEACIFETCNNYKMAKAMPPEVVERLRQEMLADGPPMWHIDYQKDFWDWK